MTTDNSYAKARRIRQWAQQGVVLVSPAMKWVKGRYAVAYHRISNSLKTRNSYGVAVP